MHGCIVLINSLILIKSTSKFNLEIAISKFFYNSTIYIKYIKHWDIYIPISYVATCMAIIYVAALKHKNAKHTASKNDSKFVDTYVLLPP